MYFDCRLCIVHLNKVLIHLQEEEEEEEEEEKEEQEQEVHIYLRQLSLRCQRAIVPNLRMNPLSHAVTKSFSSIRSVGRRWMDGWIAIITTYLLSVL